MPAGSWAQPWPPASWHSVSGRVRGRTGGPRRSSGRCCSAAYTPEEEGNLSAPARVHPNGGGPLIKQLVGLEAEVLDRVRVAVLFTDLNGRLVACNAHAEALYGWSREELLGRRTEE